MKRLLTFLSALCFSCFADAQVDTLMSWQEMDSLLTHYYFQGDIPKAWELAEMELAKAGQIYGEKHRNYLTSLNNNGSIQHILGEYKKARIFYEEALAGAKEILDEDDPLAVEIMLNLAAAYDNLGEVVPALALFESGIAKFRALHGEDDLTYAYHLNNFASLCTRMGQYQRAIPMFLRSLEILQGAVGAEWVFQALGNLFSCYSLTGQYEYAIRKSGEALALAEDAGLTGTPGYAILLYNVASLYHNLGEYQQALEIMDKSRSLMEGQVGEDLTEYCHWLNLYALLLAENGRTQESIHRFETAIKLAEGNLEAGHSLLASMKNNLALVLVSEKRYAEALEIQENALEILKNQKGAAYPEYIEILADMADLHEKMGGDSLSSAFHRQATGSVIDRIDNQFDHLSEQEQVALSQRPYNIADRLNKHQSFVVRHPEHPEAAASCFDALLIGKGIAFGNRKRLLNAVRKSEDPTVSKVYREWERTGLFLSAEYQKRVVERSPDFDSLEFRANVLESELARISQEFKEARQLVSWQDVQARLQADEAAIEFAHFRYYSRDGRTDSTLYFAYILRKDYNAPRLVYLFEERELEKSFEAISENRKESLNNLYAFRGLIPEGAKMPSGEDLLRLVWLPFDSLLQGVRRVYLSPSGLLHRVNFAGLPFSKREMLAGRYELHVLGSTRQLVFRKEASAPPVNEALLFGGIRYDRDTTAESMVNEPDIDKGKLSATTVGIPFVTRSGATGFDYLEGTLQEVLAIRETLDEAGIKVELLEGKKGTEEAFRQIGKTAPSPRILHIATHGYFYSDPKSGEEGQSAIAGSDHPMIRSGLLLAGANPAWRGEPTPPGREDGIRFSLAGRSTGAGGAVHPASGHL